MSAAREEATGLRANSAIYGPIPRQRKIYEGERYKPPEGDWDPNIPYGGKAYLARKKMPGTWLGTIFEPLWATLTLLTSLGSVIYKVSIVVFVILFACYAYFYFDHLHFNVVRIYAHAGYDVAQHKVGQHYLIGKGVERHPGKAMEWFKVAADQGHPHASHNLAVGHLKGYHQLPKGEAHRLIQHAAANGIPEAQDALNNICVDGGCM